MRFSQDMDVVSQALAKNEHVTALDLRENGRLTAVGVWKILRVLRGSKVERIELEGALVCPSTQRRRATLAVRI